jgi:hypothetical protein
MTEIFQQIVKYENSTIFGQYCIVSQRKKNILEKLVKYCKNLLKML